MFPGVSQVYVLGVNDAFVMKAWKEKVFYKSTPSNQHVLTKNEALRWKDHPVHFIADDTGAFASKLGLVFDGMDYCIVCDSQLTGKYS